MGDILSQSELNSLLAALTTTAGQASSSSRSGDIPSDRPQPPRSDSLHGPSINEAAQEIARRIGSNWSNFLQQRVEVTVESTDQLEPSTARGCDMTTESDRRGASHRGISLHWFETDLDPLIRSFEGGQASGPSMLQRELTGWDRRLIERITTLTINVMVEGIGADGRFDMPRSQPRVDERRARMRFACECPAGLVRMEICLPRAVCTRLADAAAATQAQPSSNREDRGQLQARAILARMNLTRQQLLSLSVGDLLLTDKPQTAPVELHFGQQTGLPNWIGSPGIHFDRKAVRLDSPRAVEEIAPHQPSSSAAESGPA